MIPNCAGCQFLLKFFFVIVKAHMSLLRYNAYLMSLVVSVHPGVQKSLAVRSWKGLIAYACNSTGLQNTSF